MATIEELKRALVNADKAGDIAAASAFSRQIKTQTAPQKAQKAEKYDPTEGMSTTEKVLAGVGKGMTDAGRGAGQLVGLVSDADVAEAKRLDAPLMNTGAGTAGNIIGNMAALAPTMLIPGANTVTGAALINGVAGGVLTPGSAEERLQAAGFGAGGGALGVAIPKTIGAVGKAASAAAAPFSEAGRNKIIGDVMRRAAGENADAVMARLRNPTQLVPGSLPTAAEVADSGGIAALQRAMSAANPEAYTHRGMSNNAARVEALRGIAGDEAKMQAAIAARKAAADPLYRAADNAVVTSDDALRKIMSRLPNGTLEQAQEIARMSGRPIKMGKDIPAQTIYKDAAGELVDPALMKAPQGPSARSLLSEIRKNGGINMNTLGELKLTPSEAVRGNPGLFRRDGLTEDGLLEFMQQRGWMDEAMVARANANDPGGALEIAKDYLRTALNREPVYHPSQAMDIYSHNQAMDAFNQFASGVSKTDIPAKNAQYTGRGIDLIKKAIDDVVNVSPTAPIGKNQRAAGLQVKDDLVNWADANIPEYGQARQAYAQGSVPITQMQVGQELLGKIEPALVQYHPSGSHFRQAGGAYANALNDARGNLVKNATGGIKRNLEDVMTPQQMGTLNNIAADLSRGAFAADAGRGVGSNTFQNFAMDNLTSQMGMPSAVSAIANLIPGLGKVGGIGKALGGTLYKSKDELMKQSMADALLNPQAAAGLMENSAKPGALGQFFVDRLGQDGAKRALELAPAASGALGASFALPYGSQ